MSPPFENPEAKVIAAQATAAFGHGAFFGHAAFDAVKIVLADIGFLLGGVDTSVRWLVVEAWLGNIHVDGDFVVEAQMLVNIGGCHLACGNGANGAGRAGDTVAACKDAVHVRIAEAAVAEGLDGTMVDRHARRFKGAGIDALADGFDDDVGRDARFLDLVGHERWAVVFDETGELLLGDEGGDVAVGVGFDAHRRIHGEELGAFGDGPFDLLRQGGHVLLAAAIDAGDAVGAVANRRAGDVHGDVTATDDDDLLAAIIGIDVVANLAQHLHRAIDAVAVLAVDARFLVGVGADGQIETVVIALEIGKGHILADGGFQMHVDAERKNRVDLALEELAREAVARNAVAQHAAEVLLLFKNGDLVAHERQVIGAGEPAGAAADDGNLLAGGRGAGRLWHLARRVAGKALEAADVDGVVEHVAAAAGLAWMLADVAAGHRKWVVLADQAHRIGRAAFANEGDVAGHVDLGWAQRHAWHRLLHIAEAAVVLDVLLVILAKALEPAEHKACGVGADGAGSGVDNDVGRFF